MLTTGFAVFIISMSVLAYEVALMRIFSITQWHHLAYMVISVALLGFGASGTFLSLFQKSVRKHADSFFIVFSLLFPLSLMVCLKASQSIPFNLFMLIRDWHQFLYLLLYYLTFFIPFFLGATCIGITFLKFDRHIPLFYGANLLGSGAGALAVIALLSFLKPTSAVRAVAIVSLTAPVVAGTSFRRKKLAGAAVLSTVVGIVIALFPLQTAISQYKTLSIIRGSVGTEILRTEWSPLSRIDVVESPAIKFDPAPGLSFAFQGEIPPVRGIVIDADSVTVMTDFGESLRNTQYLDYTSQALPYHLVVNPKVAILGAGGGSGVLLALLHEAKDISAVELDPKIIRLVREDYREFSGGIYSLPQVKLIAADGRGFIESSKERFDIIEIALIGSFGASAGGVYALAENYLYTVDAFKAYLERLTPEGILSITHWIQFAPRDNLKTFATAVEALEGIGITDPEKHLVFIRSWKTGTTLIKKSPFTEGQITTVREFCRKRCFDLAYCPGISRDETNKFTILSDPQPLYYDTCMSVLSGDKQRLYRDYLFDVRPATDNRPYFFHFFKWKSLPHLLKIMGRQWAPWGYVLLIATLVQAALVSVVLILFPLLFLRKGESATRKTRRLVYFLCLGLAFMFVEMSSIQKFGLFLRHPIYSMTVVISSFLVFSGFGSLSARRFMKGPREKSPRRMVPFVAIAVISLIYLAGIGRIFAFLSGLPIAGRIIASIILLAPLAFFMGMPFPSGLQNVSDRSPALVPWCWGINGCASVLSTVLATTMAMSFGFGFVMVAAVILYLIAGFIGT